MCTHTVTGNTNYVCIRSYLSMCRVFDKKKVYKSHQTISDEIDLWGHVKSLYQNPSSTCLYGKNNILKNLVSEKLSLVISVCL